MKGDREWCDANGACSYCDQPLEADDFDPYEVPPDLCKECRFPTFVEQFPERRKQADEQAPF